MRINRIKRQDLSDREWCVHTLHNLTQSSIVDYMNQHGLTIEFVDQITHLGNTLSVYMIDFFAAEYLATNKNNLGLQYRLFSRKSSGSPWHEWREEKKTSQQKIKKLVSDGILSYHAA